MKAGKRSSLDASLELQVIVFVESPLHAWPPLLGGVQVRVWFCLLSTQSPKNKNNKKITNWI